MLFQNGSGREMMNRPAAITIITTMAAVTKAGIAPPSVDTTWADYADIAVESPGADTPHGLSIIPARLER
ncbi:hypothetical protein [Ensifer sp. LCM 4579]|uniref:hypothetical protein n=1 Tax=Ensifer sp. LCM 4579 TaxID=1848292 RepID=UPI0008DAC663|nr:hypothetical protein [Ensifer sp. LCM 4579]OHV72750.1 hypothetical protein LCM4579_11670 [Ensifer sp. LCM 4579]